MLINVSIKLFFAIKAVLQQRLKQDKDGVSLDLSRWLKKGKMSYTSVNFQLSYCEQGMRFARRSYSDNERLPVLKTKRRVVDFRLQHASN